MISYRCMCSVKLHHVSLDANTLLLRTDNINTQLTVNSPESAEMSVHSPKLLIQWRPIEVFQLLWSQLWDLRVVVRCSVTQYRCCTCMLPFCVCLRSPFHLIKRLHIPRVYSVNPFVFGMRVWIKTCLVLWLEVKIKIKEGQGLLKQR